MFDISAEHSPQKLWDAFDTIFGSRIDAAKRVGCQAVKEGLRVYSGGTVDGKPIDPTQRQMIWIGFGPNDRTMYFTVSDSMTLRN
jgi:hypothetical protein